ncbi:HAD-IC family P-type ATPase [Lactobacillus sp. S2-2]|uniref:HAD-IC family P-type ATPase n=1 Tax=Lactobacillus sp. S2-2 TaxID=2692917 RepID=UPI001F02F5AA|nr:HAD-IC family P-type ATPase [Lactobacillus sp. S2-2]MCF6515292.1 HAD-IC family P-type ATPase [Lactobacillus sp. S2-2]
MNNGINLKDVDLKNGLTDEQVQKQLETGNKNIPPKSLTRSNKQIFSDNIFTLFNMINVLLAALVIFTGSYKNLVFIVIAIVNTSIGIFQEIRSKRQVDKMALLSQTNVKVIRNGVKQTVQPEDVVLGDLIVLDRGDQVSVDGKVITTKGIGVDESQITGESNIISKHNDDEITSGSFLVSGEAVILATKVGKEAFVNYLTNEARMTESKNSVLINLLKKIIKTLTIIIIPVGIILFISRLLHGLNINESILGTVAAMTGMIPEGLVLLTSVTLAVSAYTLAKKRVLVRELSSIETLARVDTICLDKTGTITTGNLKFEKTLPQSKQYDNNQINEIIGDLSHIVDDKNETATALKNQFSSKNPFKSDLIVPFSSAKKWSGAQIKQGQFVLGAPQFILKMNESQKNIVQENAEKGNRVLALVKVNDLSEDGFSNPELISFILISDEIRENAADTLAYFTNLGARIRIISGDDPMTVSNIGMQVGIEDADKYIDMSSLKDPIDYQALTRNYVIFGRVTPTQKQNLMKAYQQDDHTVAMTGDGVNDLLALKQADCGIAMASGSESVKSIADVVLIDSNFASMIDVLKEGRRVINNIDSISSLYLIKTMYSIMLAVIFVFVAKNYPFQPIQLTPINAFMVGMPTFLLALQPSYEIIKNRFVKNIYAISIPASLTVVVYILGIGILGHFLQLSNHEISSLNVLMTGAISWISLINASAPITRFKMGLIVFSAGAFVSVFTIFNNFFSLASLIDLRLGLIAIILLASVVFVYKIIQKFILGTKEVIDSK